ncbi:hypothetical protein QTP70_018084 [Hemibagrus guttatus]|uniref:SRCR domain-containing protein n=1 Tax=Hemibagrus guttatus TaxID=175788 RepID=A0AAE0UUA5_9TELE|nr:hypothetical protein QTP70_018084 [Hemibagrus guttatus]
MKVSRSKTEYMCVNEREGSGTVRLQGEEVKKVQEFKYLGSTVQSNGECGKEVKKRLQADSVRLVNGGSRCAGRVEVLHDGQWGTVCDDNWDKVDAAVVCSELRCGEAVEALGDNNAHFGRGSGTILMDEVACSGSESTLKNCRSRGWGNSDCGHGEDAGVICSGQSLRLTAGPHQCSGRVEVFHGRSWSTVCDADFDQQDAEVVCRELDCGIPVEVLGSAAFGRGEGQVWTEELQCRGTESEISFCPTSSSLKHSDCSHDNDVGLICSGHTEARLVNGSDSCSGRVELQYLRSSMALHEGRVRLSGGSECQGEVEIYFRQDWRRVLLDSWSLSEASVLCRQLGCGSVLNYRSSPSTTEHKHMCVTGFSCSGSEAHLGNCSSAQAEPVNCSSGEQLHITCSDPHSIRLVGSGGDCAGRLEVFHSGSWGTVCDDSWDIEDAQVVCRQLQCGVALSTHIPAWFGPGTGSIWLNEVECEGNETSLWNCRFQLCEEGECGHHEDVGVVCSEFKEIRLTEGCEGNLEVFYNGTWGNVCHNQMEQETADMVCRELNCGRSKLLDSARARVQSAPNWLDELKCRKHDSNLLKCPSSPWGQNRCDNRDEVARITCTDDGKSPRTQENCSSLPSQKHCSKHWSLRLSGGKGSCSGTLAVYHNSTWGSVCDDQWNIRNAQVVCRQLGCGSALSADRKVSSGSGEGTIWLNRVKCRGDEIHLWDCHHSLKEHTDCYHAGVTCADISTVSTATPTTTTTTTTSQVCVFVRMQYLLLFIIFLNISDHSIISTSSSVFLTSVRDPPTPPLVLFVLGTLLFLALVLLLVLFYQNRVLRRVVSRTRRKTEPEAVYEEINHRYMARRITSFTQRGSLLSEEQHSGYEDVDDELLSVKSGMGEKAEYYDDVIDTSDLISDPGRVDPPEDYDDAVTAGPIPDNVDEDEAENYDDAITADQKSVILTEDVSENYDDAVTTETNPNIITESPEDYDDVITEEQDVGETEEYDDVEEKSQKDRDHVTETRLQRPFLRKLHFNFYKRK